MSGQSVSVLEGLADRLIQPVGPEALARAALHLVDWTGCALAGAATATGAALRRTRGPGRSGLAFHWGGLGNVLEMDDVDRRAILHCGPTVIPAALASVGAGRTGGAGRGAQAGGMLLDAIVRGYEAVIRLGRAAGPGHYAMWHSTGSCGPIGAAVAAGTMIGLGRDGLVRAMSLGLSQSAGLWQTRHDPASAGKQIHTAHAARAGHDAARLAAAGLSGPRFILEGEQGFFAAMCPGGDPQAVLEGEGWALHETSFKPWPACRHAHAAIDAALLARRGGVVTSPAIRAGEVVVKTYADALKFCDKPEPMTVSEAKFSLQHCVAAALVRGAPRLSDFEVEAIGARDIAAMRARVSVEVAEPFAGAYPAHYGASVSVQGQTFTAADALGDPENPMSPEAISEKAVTLIMAGGWQEADARTLAGDALEVQAPGRLARLIGALP